MEASPRRSLGEISHVSNSGFQTDLLPVLATVGQTRVEFAMLDGVSVLQADLFGTASRVNDRRVTVHAD